jgi:hypothetical protein
MKPVKNFVFAVLLVSVLAFTAFAGDIETPGYAPPPPPRMSTTTDETAPDTSTDSQETTVEIIDYSLLDTLVALLSVY